MKKIVNFDINKTPLIVAFDFEFTIFFTIKQLFYLIGKGDINMTLKIGDKVRNIHDDTEGTLAYSSFGASVTGFGVNEDGQAYHFKTLGQPLSEFKKDWKRIYKFKYNMKDYLDLKETKE